MLNFQYSMNTYLFISSTEYRTIKNLHLNLKFNHHSTSFMLKVHWSIYVKLETVGSRLREQHTNAQLDTDLT